MSTATYTYTGSEEEVLAIKKFVLELKQKKTPKATVVFRYDDVKPIKNIKDPYGSYPKISTSEPGQSTIIYRNRKPKKITS
jgi:hypothetical protein